jgi:glutathione S-transferase
MYILYHFPFSQHSRRVVSLLVEGGLEYEARFVDMAKGEHQSADYLRINPNHQVPTLIDGDVKIHESNAILRYLCFKHDLAQWYPKSLPVRASVEQWLDWNQCRLSPAVVDIVLNSVFLGDRGDAAAVQRGKSRLLELEPVIEATLSRFSYIAGASPTIADLSLASSIFQLTLANIHVAGDGTRSWFERVSRLEGFRRSLPTR